MKKVIKIMLTLIVAFTLCTTNLQAYQQGWKKTNDRWWYQNADGTYPKSSWKKVSSKWYYFDNSGYMAKNKWVGNYYLQSNGAMATSKWIGAYYVDANGKWDKTKKKTTTTTTASVTNSAKTTKTTGTKVGSINIARVGYTMPLYEGSQSQYQEIVDNENSALYVKSFFGGNGMIADHAAQGLKKQKSCVKGDTMTLTVNGKTTKYVMTAIYTNGQNVGNGIKIGSKYADEMTDGSLFIYCCNDATGKSVTVTFWKLI